MTSRHHVLVAVAVALTACAGSRAASRAGPAPLASASTVGPLPLAPGFPALRARFDADAPRARLLVLASPT